MKDADSFERMGESVDAAVTTAGPATPAADDQPVVHRGNELAIEPQSRGGARAGIGARVTIAWTDQRLFLAMYAVVALALLWIARSAIFGPPIYEISDFAANAMQIDRAKHFAEYLGNYSRFGFHHPGPAFFYVYAAGEVLFRDMTGLVAAPANAHLIAGLLLQAGFLSGALTIIATMPGVQPGRTLAVGAAIAVGHFGLAGGPMFSLWPPYVLVLPTLLFGTCLVGLWLGRAWLLPVLVIAGGFLVNGHIGQPLFVVPLGVVAELGLLLSCRRRGISVPRAPHLVAAAVLVPFALPILVDVAHGATSNLALAFASSPLAHHHVREAIGSLTTILGYQPVVVQPAVILGTSIAWGPLLAWTMAVVVPTAVLLRRRHPLAKPLLGAVGAYALLTLVWQVIQPGPAWAFNDYFVVGIMFLGLIPLILVLASIPRAGLLAATLAAVVIVIAPRPSTLFAVDPTGQQIHDSIAALDAPTEPILLRFTADEAHWTQAVGVALALQRRSIAFEVDPAWGFMFGADHVYVPTDQVIVWQLRVPQVGDRRLSDKIAIAAD